MAPRPRVKSGGRLVEEQKVRISDQAEGQVEPAELAAGQVPGACIPLLAELDELDELVDRAPAGVVPTVHFDQLGDRQVVLDAGLLEDHADSLPQPALAVGRIHPEHSGLAARARAVTLEDLHGRRLAGAVGPEQTKHLTPRDLEAHPAYSVYLAVGLAQVAHLDGEFVCLCLSLSHASQARLDRAAA